MARKYKGSFGSSVARMRAAKRSGLIGTVTLMEYGCFFDRKNQSYMIAKTGKCKRAKLADSCFVLSMIKFGYAFTCLPSSAPH